MSRLPQISHQELRQRLQNGIVHFAFRTKTGDIRFAMGTLNLTHIPRDFHPKGGESSPKVVPFFDTEKGGWRSVQVKQIIWG